jgi:hypothetical protein
MDLLVEHVDVWAASIQDKPGALATVLAELRESGADLQFIIARRAPEAPGKGVVFVTPLQGDGEIAAAAQLSFNVTRTVHSVRVMGPDRRGIAAEPARWRPGRSRQRRRIARISGVRRCSDAICNFCARWLGSGRKLCCPRTTAFEWLG